MASARQRDAAVRLRSSRLLISSMRSGGTRSPPLGSAVSSPPPPSVVVGAGFDLPLQAASGTTRARAASVRMGPPRWCMTTDGSAGGLRALGEVAGDDQPLDLAGPLVDLGD